MKKLLLAVDGSGASLRATWQAIELARLAGGTIHLVHAHEEPLIYGEIAVYVPRERMAALQEEHSRDVMAPAEEALKGAGVRFESEVLVGPVAHVVAERAAQLGCDAIVMGRHGKSALADVLVGSVAMKVLHLSALPVLLVR